MTEVKRKSRITKAVESVMPTTKPVEKEQPSIVDVKPTSGHYEYLGKHPATGKDLYYITQDEDVL